MCSQKPRGICRSCLWELLLAAFQEGVGCGLYSLDPDLRLNFFWVGGLGQDKSRTRDSSFSQIFFFLNT